MRAYLVDSQLLLLFVVGITARSFIAKHKRLGAYTELDFDLLCELLDEGDSVVVTPNVLTETSNLLGHAREPMRTRLYDVFGDMLREFDERYVRSSSAAARDEFVRLGLTDVAVLAAAEGDCALLTADVGLYLAAENAGREVVNFNHKREERGLV